MTKTTMPNATTMTMTMTTTTTTNAASLPVALFCLKQNGEYPSHGLSYRFD
jgi:hypothetical protein